MPTLIALMLLLVASVGRHIFELGKSQNLEWSALLLSNPVVDTVKSTNISIIECRANITGYKG